MARYFFSDDAWENSSQQVSRALELMKLESGAAMLDLACGPGRHALELARRGFQVTGVDRNIEYLREARRGAEEEGLEVELVQEDMRQFSRPEVYDGAWSMFTSFGYFDRPDDNQQVLNNVYKSLKKGGVFLLELAGREVIARIFEARSWREVAGVFLLEERHVEQNWTKMRNRQILLKDSEKIEFTITHWLYSGAELAGMLAASGFSPVEIFGDLSGSPYDQTAKRLVAVAHK